MNLQFSKIVKYVITFSALTSVLYYFSYRYDSKKVKFSKISLTFVKDVSKEMKKIELMSQELKFLCRAAGYNICYILEMPTLRNLIANTQDNILFDDYIAIDFISKYSATDITSEYSEKQLTISYTISNDLLFKNTAIQEDLQELPKNLILNKFEWYRDFLNNEKTILDKHKEIFSNLEQKKNSLLISKNLSKLADLENLYSKISYIKLKEKTEVVLFREISNALRLALSTILSILDLLF
jgi:hypothetical protein